jgi:hypothetical protein
MISDMGTISFLPGLIIVVMVLYFGHRSHGSVAYTRI